ncbi:MAG: prepilin peptidase [Rhodospirillales bacterium]|nr:prepilin peptidase [Rhodospirillales bacterium]
MTVWIAYICLLAALALLAALSVIDLRTRLLPDKLVAPFALLGLVFHASLSSAILSPAAIVLGGLTGFVTLYLIRAVANRLYKMDALGLGDVKLMAAAGLWLGPDAVMLALSAGAFAGLLHGLGYGLYRAWKTGRKTDFKNLQIPAGPGFAVGIILAGIYRFYEFFPF